MRACTQRPGPTAISPLLERGLCASPNPARGFAPLLPGRCSPAGCSRQDLLYLPEPGPKFPTTYPGTKPCWESCAGRTGGGRTTIRTLEWTRSPSNLLGNAGAGDEPGLDTGTCHPSLGKAKRCSALGDSSGAVTNASASGGQGWQRAAHSGHRQRWLLLAAPTWPSWAVRALPRHKRRAGAAVNVVSK